MESEIGDEELVAWALKSKKTRNISDEDDEEDSEVVSKDEKKSQLTHCTKFILEKGLDSLLKKYSINCNRHKKYNNLVQLSYSLLDSPMQSPIVQECRGLILDENEGYKVVAFPYKKFFNYGENGSASIDWKTARVYEKIDGSLLTLYFAMGEWHVASSSLPDASGKISGLLNAKERKEDSTTFADVFWMLWKQKNYRLPDEKTRCYMFELVSKRNIVVVRYEAENLIFHGCRDLETLQELDPVSVASQYGWEVAPTFPLKSLAETLEASRNLNPMKSEGFVVCDKNFNRVKIKSPQYVALSLMSNYKDQKGNRRLIEIVRTNEGQEFLAYFPECKEDYESLKSQYVSLVKSIDSSFSKVKKMSVKEAFKLCSTLPYGDIALTLLKNGNKGVKEYLRDLEIKELEELLKSTQESRKVEESVKEKNLELKFSESLIRISEEARELVNSLSISEDMTKVREKFMEKLRKMFLGEPGVIDIQMFGSSASGIGTKDSDLDVCVMTSESSVVTTKVNTAKESVSTHRNAVKILEKNGMTKILEISTARYPVIKFYDPEFEISCDLSFGNHLGVNKAQYIRYLASAEERFRQMVIIAKYWAKRRGINNPAQFTLNSFVVTLAVEFFLQIKQILPVLEMDLQNSSSEKIGDVPTFPVYILSSSNFKPRTASIGELLLQFFDYFANEFDYLNDCISVRLGKVIKKKETPIDQTATPNIFSVEDPFVVAENTARTVSNHSLTTIRSEFNRAFILLREGKSLKSVCDATKSKKESEKYAVQPLDYVPYKKGKKGNK